ncbi:membrane protein insertion efficiency factor YidD [Laspinema sp. D1]|uniref:Membrane protein insertion efficiency factor YidD n=1 Tax=Laspinema palackyanum D2a TaxID=2953684 RepID=A0ABT2ML77_9CYAN|nr:membrane protein insertion efficiency factor YidD [Laspinema sp. D2a]
MNSNGLDARLLMDSRLLRLIAIASISGYQKHLSPHKGFSCAHRILYGGDSCSQYIKTAIAQRGLSEAIALSQHRFAACKEAHHILRSQVCATTQPQKKPKRSSPNRVQDCACTELTPGVGCDACTDSLECLNLLDCCGGITCSDCSPLEDSALDCSSCDCDFGSCG